MFSFSVTDSAQPAPAPTPERRPLNPQDRVLIALANRLLLCRYPASGIYITQEELESATGLKLIPVTKQGTGEPAGVVIEISLVGKSPDRG